MNRFDVLRRALEGVYSGEQQMETEAVMDKIDDAGWALVPKLKPAHKVGRAA